MVTRTRILSGHGIWSSSRQCSYMYYYEDITRLMATRICTAYCMSYDCDDRYMDSGTHGCHVYIALLHVHVMLTYHCYTCMSYFPVTHVYMVSLYSCHMDHHAYYMYYRSVFPYSWYMIVSCYCYWYGYSRYWTWELLRCDMWTSTSIVPVSRYIVHDILFMLYCSWFPLYCSTLSTELRSRYHVHRIMYSSCSCYIVYLILKIIKITWVWGRLDGWLDLIGWCIGSILLVPLQGTVVLPTNCSMSSCSLFHAPFLAKGPGLGSQGIV